MKRLIALAALALAASACATTTNTNEGGNTNANASASPAATATPAGVSQADLEAKERQVWDAIKAKNWDAFGGMLADDFTLVGEDGAHTKQETLDQLKKYDLTEYTFSDFKFVKVDDDLAVLVYTSTEKSTFDGKPSPGTPSYDATAWANRGGKWVAVYHQETAKMEAPAGQGGNTNANSSSNANASNMNANANANASGANANTSASPSASPAAPATATDAEKAVWAALKAKDYDTFAGFLASGAMEVEPDGVHDKSSSVEGVKHFDFSKFTQSDFKETKLDADSTLVTYVVTGPMNGKTATERHTTIWNNRGGRWQAYFHQGTVAAK